MRLLSAVLFGFGPAVFAGRQRSAELLKAGTRVANASTRARRVRGGLIVVEVGLSVTLLVVAGLLVRTYGALQRVPPGFDPVNLSAVRVSIPKTVPMTARPAIWEGILARVRALPGVTGADIGGMPLDPGGMMGDIEPEGGRPAGVGPIRLASMYLTQPSYFRVTRIGHRGRMFGGDTTAGVPGPED